MLTQAHITRLKDIAGTIKNYQKVGWNKTAKMFIDYGVFAITERDYRLIWSLRNIYCLEYDNELDQILATEISKQSEFTRFSALDEKAVDINDLIQAGVNTDDIMFLLSIGAISLSER